jgi:hypothetical protein
VAVDALPDQLFDVVCKLLIEIHRTISLAFRNGKLHRPLRWLTRARADVPPSGAQILAELY